VALSRPQRAGGLSARLGTLSRGLGVAAVFALVVAAGGCAHDDDERERIRDEIARAGTILDELALAGFEPTPCIDSVASSDRCWRVDDEPRAALEALADDVSPAGYVGTELSCSPAPGSTGGQERCHIRLGAILADATGGIGAAGTRGTSTVHAFTMQLMPD